MRIDADRVDAVAHARVQATAHNGIGWVRQVMHEN